MTKTAKCRKILKVVLIQSSNHNHLESIHKSLRGTGVIAAPRQTSGVHAGSETLWSVDTYFTVGIACPDRSGAESSPESRLRYATRKIIFVSKGIANEITLAILSSLRQVFCPCPPASKVTTKPQRSPRLMIKHKCAGVRASACTRVHARVRVQ